jgi:hypoxanthine phosphoribosyltransferase
MSLVDKTKVSIYGLQVLIAEDYSSKEEIMDKVKAKISNLQLIDDEDDARESIKLLQAFLKDCIEQGKKMKKLELKEKIYEDALFSANSSQTRKFILQKLEDIDTDKNKFL